jgi:hypothetical protein
MALDRNALATALLAGFQMGMDDPDWTKEQAAEAMADAIDTYVRGAAVTGISTQVVDAAMVPIGTGSQIGTGSLA